MDGWKRWDGKRVFIILNNNRKYTGKVVSIDDAGNGLVFINIVDKFARLVTITSGEIKLIQEEEDE